MKTLYETDFSAWIESQVQALKKKDFAHLDIEHLLEEMETLGDSLKEAIESHLIILLMHKLKQLVQPERDGKSWNDSIINARFQIEHKRERQPSLRNYSQKVFIECFHDARRHASKQTGIDLRKFPQVCPWTFEEVMGDNHEHHS